MKIVGSVEVYFDEDADLSVLKDKTIGIIGYGNQGRAWSLNMRDSGLNVIVGNVKDEYWKRAAEDGFEVYPIKEAASKSDVICLLIPDEVMPKVYHSDIHNGLKSGKTLCFASGYNITYGFIRPPKDMNVVLVAPRMIGKSVRELFQKGKGAPALVAVEQDSDGKAWEISLALAKALGFTRAGAFKSSFEEETLSDLISEQVVDAAFAALLTLAFEKAVEAGVRPEIEVLELYASGEIVEIWKSACEMGLYEQMKLHSTTSQYGQLSRSSLFLERLQEVVEKVVNKIVSGEFAREWAIERQVGYPLFHRLHKRVAKHPMFEAERRILELLRGRS